MVQLSSAITLSLKRSDNKYFPVWTISQADKRQYENLSKITNSRKYRHTSYHYY